LNHDRVTLLIVEDDEGHATLVERNLKRAGVANPIVHLSNGRAALDYVRSEGAHAGLKHDSGLLILLDIKMPELDGVQVLEALKKDERTAQIPVIMLSTTDDPREVEACYRMGCSVYITKPVSYEEFVEAVRRLGLFLQIVKLPSIGALNKA
jgi:CheY-like chemotaxis protein